MSSHSTLLLKIVVWLQAEARPRCVRRHSNARATASVQWGRMVPFVRLPPTQPHWVSTVYYYANYCPTRSIEGTPIQKLTILKVYRSKKNLKKNQNSSKNSSNIHQKWCQKFKICQKVRHKKKSEKYLSKILPKEIVKKFFKKIRKKKS